MYVYNDCACISPPLSDIRGKVQEEQVDRLNEQWREEENKKGKNLTEEDENTTSRWLRIGIEQVMKS